jgi:tRNA threonylcarbamoyladenosine biosynthesis protein TsaB
MPALAVDTTAEFGSIALIDASGVREEVLLYAPRGFSGPLFEQIEALLARRNVPLAEIDLFAGASGPGSFTGVRIGLAAMKGLAEVLGKPVIAVSNLEALAEFGQADLRATVIDARRGEVFAALFDRGGAPVIAECVAPFPRFLEMLGDRECEFVSTNFDPFQPALRGTRFERCPGVTAPRALAGAIGQIALRRAASGAVSDPAAIEANYVRRSDAELLWKLEA